MTRLVNLGWILLVATSLGWFGWQAHHLFLKLPPIWPDEALFADPAIDLIRRGTMGTKLLTGLLPGIEHHTYWMPPGYFLFLALVFWLAQPGLIALRLSSLIMSIGLMGLMYPLGRRSGLSRPLAFVPLALLGVDQLYLRGSLMGRMDVLTLFFMVLTLIRLIPPTPLSSRNRWSQMLTGLCASFALLVHPMGVVVPLVVFFAGWQSSRRTFGWLCLGLAIPLLLWGIYLLQAPADFWFQFGGQLTRKQDRPPLPFSLRGLLLKLHPYEVDRELVILWFLGLGGLWVAARHSPLNRVLPFCQLLLLGLVLWGQENWYFIYLAPLTFLGLAHWVKKLNLTKTPSLAQFLWVIPCLLIACYAIRFAKLNVHRTAAWHQEQNKIFKTDYFSWAQKISDQLPPGSRVFIASIPDPTFVLWSRPDLVLHSFVPEGIPVSDPSYRQVMESVDYFVVSQPPPNEREAKFAKEHGELIATVGSPLKPAYFARIYKIPSPSSSAANRLTGGEIFH